MLAYAVVALLAVDTPAPAGAPRCARDRPGPCSTTTTGRRSCTRSSSRRSPPRWARRKRASGELWLRKPGRMRWDYAKPEKKLMVADGQTLWVYEPEDEQAFKQELRSTNLPDSVAFLLGEGKLLDQFDVTNEPTPPDGVAQPGEAVLRLRPEARHVRVQEPPLRRRPEVGRRGRDRRLRSAGRGEPHPFHGPRGQQALGRQQVQVHPPPPAQES